MNILKLKALSEIVTCGSFTKAAEKMNYSQPALTRMINSLEEEMGVTLLARSSRGARLTETGQDIWGQIQEILSTYDQLEEVLNQNRRRQSKTITIGSYESASITWLPLAITKMKHYYPDVEIVVRAGLGQDIRSWAEEGSVDLTLVSKFMNLEDDWVELKKDPWLAIGPKNMKTKHDYYPIEDFEGSPFLIPSYGMDLDVMQIFLKNKVTPNFSRIAVDDPVVISLVSQGHGISMITELVLKAYVGETQVKALPVYPPIFRELGIGIRSMKNASPMVKQLIECLKEVAL
jgi:DNA-binding transcriptional LysR family regulator